MSQPRISQLNTWESFEEHVLKILLGALSILRNKTNIPQEERLLNREFFFCLRKADDELWFSGKGGLNRSPVPEGKNPPHPNDKQQAKRENKVPDFYWDWRDNTASNPDWAWHYYCVECKRLGKPTSPQWILTENYVRDGVLRFITEEHGYAKGEKSGAMVGYIQNMQMDDILREVNNFAQQASISAIVLSDNGWKDGGVSKLDQHLDLPEVLPTPFDLRHLWVDLRQHYLGTTSKSKSTRKK